MDAANEAGISRRYGGIHFKDGICTAAAGKKIEASLRKAQEYIRGKVKP